MTYHTDNKIRKYVRGYGFLSFTKNFGRKYGKKFLNKRILASKRVNTAASKLNQSKYGQVLKKEVDKQLSNKIVPAAIDVAGSKTADKITSLKVKDDQKPEEGNEEITIPPEKRQQIINDLRLFYKI